MTVRADIITLLDTVSTLGKRNYADEKPQGETLPNTVILDGVSQAPGLSGDSRTLAWNHLLQVDLWEDAAVSSEVTRDAVVNVLDGALLSGKAFHLKVQSVQRLYDPDPRLAHTAITLKTTRLR